MTENHNNYTNENHFLQKIHLGLKKEVHFGSTFAFISKDLIKNDKTNQENEEDKCDSNFEYLKNSIHKLQQKEIRFDENISDLSIQNSKMFHEKETTKEKVKLAEKINFYEETKLEKRKMKVFENDLIFEENLQMRNEVQ